MPSSTGSKKSASKPKRTVGRPKNSEIISSLREELAEALAALEAANAKHTGETAPPDYYLVFPRETHKKIKQRRVAYCYVSKDAADEHQGSYDVVPVTITK